MRPLRVAPADEAPELVVSPIPVCSVSCAVTHKTQRKLFLGILGVGISALVLDRLVLSGGDPPPAEDQYTVDASSPELADATSIPEIDVATTENSIRARLSSVAESIPPGECTDAFTIPASWRVVAGEQEHAQMPVKASTGFTTHYTLSTVMASESGNGFVTLVSRKLNQPGRITLQLGNVIDGHKLVKIYERSAEFEGPEGPITLTIAEPETSRQAAASKRAGESDGQ